MATSSISGLASGLDTASIINQLLQLEAVPQTRLKTQLTTEKSAQTALQALNTQVAGLQTLAKDLAATTTWRALKATSSSADVAVSSTSNGPGGSFSFTVDQVATAHRLSFAATAAGSDVVVPDGTTVELTIGGQTKVLDTRDGTLNGLVDALNAAGTDVRASKVRLDDGSFRLVVTAGRTGAEAAFTLTGSTGAALLGGAAVSAGRDAAITVGSDTIHSSSNTFNDVIPGLSFTVSSKAVGTTVDIDSTSDTAGVQQRAAAFVEAVNAALATIDRLTAYGATPGTGGVLAGDANLRGLRSQLLESVYPTDGGTLAAVGIQTTRSGRLSFDAAAFAEAHNDDPAAVEKAFVAGAVGGPAGFAARVERLAQVTSAPFTGSLSSAITGKGESIDRLEDRIESWDTRLELRRTTLTRQYTALETALNQLTSQSNWLSSQLASLNNTE